MDEPALPEHRGGGLVRVRVDLAYDGTDFAGWAVQPGLRTVQGVLEDALATVLRVPRLATVVAGRTDAGVHARGQVVHVDVPADALAANRGRSREQPEEVLRRRLSGVLGPDVVVSAVTRAPEGFDARFSALRRRYTYRFCDDPVGVPPLLRREVVAVRGELDVLAMRAAAAGLLGLHDFAAYCRRREGATTVRTLLRLDWERRDGLVVAVVEADAFCHSMVRALVGACAGVGLGRQPLDWPGRVLLAGRRDGAVQVARAHGLVLEEVVYPDDELLAARAREARSRREEVTAPGAGDDPAAAPAARPAAGR